jgi:hypothetical protein
MLYHDLGLQKNDDTDEKACPPKLGALIGLSGRLQGCFARER